MYTAIEKRRENIAEYILYLWQLEDLLRALQFSPEAIYSQLVAPRKLDPRQSEQLLAWYVELAALLQRESKQEGGHLEHTLHLIADLNNLHLQLMKLPAGARYRVLYGSLEPELAALRVLVGKSETLGESHPSDIELCFRALYAALLYRIKGDEKGQKAIEDVIELISPVIAELAAMYRKVEQGEIDLFGGEDQAI